MQLKCPICGSDKFTAQGKRETARCMGCQSLERGRLFWMIAKRIDLFRQGAKVMHIAPEIWFVRNTDVVKKCKYWAYDFDTQRYQKFPVPVAKIDLCTDLPNLPEDEFDVIVHHHVLEHLPCALRPVLNGFRRILKPGGTMAFSMPIRPAVDTVEDLSPDLTAEERTSRFGQHNHMRAFGRNDVVQILEAGLGGSIQIDSGRELTEEELIVASVPPVAAAKLTAQSTILFKKPGASL
jgi:SAM-dependent methyltransferase